MQHRSKPLRKTDETENFIFDFTQLYYPRSGTLHEIHRGASTRQWQSCSSSYSIGPSRHDTGDSDGDAMVCEDEGRLVDELEECAIDFNYGSGRIEVGTRVRRLEVREMGI